MQQLEIDQFLDLVNPGPAYVLLHQEAIGLSCLQTEVSDLTESLIERLLVLARFRIELLPFCAIVLSGSHINIFNTYFVPTAPFRPSLSSLSNRQPENGQEVAGDAPRGQHKPIKRIVRKEGYPGLQTEQVTEVR